MSILILIASSILMVLLSVVLPLTTQVVIDELTQTGQLNNSIIVVTFCALAIVIESTLGYFKSGLLYQQGAKKYAEVSSSYLSYFVKNAHNIKLDKLNSWLIPLSENMKSYWLSGGYWQVTEYISIAILMSIIFAISPKIAMVLIFFTFMAFAVNYYSSSASNSNDELNYGSAIFSEDIRSYISHYYSNSFRFGAEESEGVRNKILRNTNNFRKIGDAQEKLFSFNRIIQSAAVLSILILSCHEVMNGHITIGQIFSIQMISLRVLHPAIKMTSFLTDYYMHRAELTKMKLALSNRDAPLNDRWAVPGIVFMNGIYKRYLRNTLSVSFVLGKHYLLKGESGSGKTTIAKIISGQECADSGVFIFDKKIISADNFGYLRNNVSYLSGNTLSSKDAMGKIVSMHERMSDAERCLFSEFQLLDVLNKEPKDEVILSLGEAQRINVIIAILAKPELIILDEALNGISEKLEASIISAIKIYLCNSTIIYISHRESLCAYFEYHLSLSN